MEKTKVYNPGVRRGRGRPPVNATSIHLRLPPAELDALDAWIARHPEPKPTRPEAIRAILRELREK
jgi:hypothetical protein